MISVVSLGVIVGVLNLNNNINALNNNKIEDQEVTKGITIIKELEAQDVLESEEKIELVPMSVALWIAAIPPPFST